MQRYWSKLQQHEPPYIVPRSDVLATLFGSASLSFISILMTMCLGIATCLYERTQEKYKLYKHQSSVNVYKYFLVTEFVTFGIVYLISWLSRSLLITLEDCLIKLICLLQ